MFLVLSTIIGHSKAKSNHTRFTEHKLKRENKQWAGSDLNGKAKDKIQEIFSNLR